MWGITFLFSPIFVVDHERGEVACGKHRADGEVPRCRLLPWRCHEGPGLLRADGISRGAHSFLFRSPMIEKCRGDGLSTITLLGIFFFSLTRAYDGEVYKVRVVFCPCCHVIG